MTAASLAPLLSVVVPVLDEEGSVGELVERVRKAVAGEGVELELIFVDDGSRDATAERIAAARLADPRVRSLHFTRSFGHQAALAAGLEAARGDAVVTMDGDLQHPPEVIPRFLAAWREGAQVVSSVRADPGRRAGRFKRWTSGLFYRFFSALGDVPELDRGADFRLLDRAVVDELVRLSERFLFYRGLVPWLGFRTTVVEYALAPRFAGRSKYRLRRMTRLALNGIVSFSLLPLRAIALLGFVTTALGLAYGVFAIAWHLAGGEIERGWTSLVVVVVTFGGIQLLSLGIVSEYVGRLYEETKRRPRYVVAARRGFDRRDETPETTATTARVDQLSPTSQG